MHEFHVVKEWSMHYDWLGVELLDLLTMHRVLH